MVTPFALKERFDKLAEFFATDPVHANVVLRKLIPQGLKCLPQYKTEKQNLNHNNSKWTVTEEILVHEPLHGEKATAHFVDAKPVNVDTTL